MSLPKFDKSELNIRKTIIDKHSNLPIHTFTYPESMADAVRATYRREPHWQITPYDYNIFVPNCNPDTVARGAAVEARDIPPVGGRDIFGVDWLYMPDARGSMVRPGNPTLSDANEWRDKLVWPDITKWDWDSCAEANNGVHLTDDKCNTAWLMNGWFERLISLMDFEGAVMALIDEDQVDAVKAFFEELSKLYIRIIDAYIKHFPQIDGFTIHDDWGSQMNTFFSPAIAEEMIVPYMRMVTDHIHSRGRFADFHSCGHNYVQVPNMIAAGWDSWVPQAMNDTADLYDKYGDQIIIAVVPEQFDPNKLTESEIRAKAREFVDRFNKPGKPCILNQYGTAVSTPAYMEELYVYSRKKFAGDL